MLNTDEEITLGGPEEPDFAPRLFDEHDDDRRGLDNEIVDDPMAALELGDEQANTAEILGIVEQDAILSTLEQARDNRRPCLPMMAVDLDAPLPEDEVLLGAEAAEGFPIFSQLLEAWRAAGKPRIVRVDTEADYQAFRDASSPERMALLARVARLEEELHDHLQDPDAHSPAVTEALEEAEGLAAAEEGKRIPMRMPRHFDGLLEQWHEGGMAAGSMVLPRPGPAKGRYIVTASESVKKGELEAAKAAAEAGVPASAIVGYLAGIGASLAAADATKSLASGALSILQRPEAKAGHSFMVRLDPQVSPAIFALAELHCLCQLGRADACGEWTRLKEAAPAPLRQAMAEVERTLQPTALTALGGAVSDFFSGIWHKVRGFFAGEAAPVQAAVPALPPGTPKALPQRASA